MQTLLLLRLLLSLTVIPSLPHLLARSLPGASTHPGLAPSWPGGGHAGVLFVQLLNKGDNAGRGGGEDRGGNREGGTCCWPSFSFSLSFLT